jgi:hypothetical protein
MAGGLTAKLLLVFASTGIIGSEFSPGQSSKVLVDLAFGVESCWNPQPNLYSLQDRLYV